VVASFTLGSLESEFVRADVLRRSYPDCDPEWLDVRIDVSIGPFSGSNPASWRAGFLPPFRRALVTLYETLNGDAVLQPDWERSLMLTLTGDGRGHVSIYGEACPDRGTLAAVLRFALPDIDQTYLPRLIAEFGTIEREFP